MSRRTRHTHRRRSGDHDASACNASRDRRDGRDSRDEGSALIIALALIVLCAFVILPILDYAQAVSRQTRVLQTKTTRVEAVKGGLRTAMSDPVNLFKTCDAAGLTIPVTLGGPGLNTAVDTKCWKMASTLAEDPNTLRYGLATTKAGAMVPSGTVGTAMPGSGGTPVNAWVAQTTTSPADDKMWLPQLPSRHLNVRSPIGYSMPAGYPNCLVYFPGTYVDPITIDGSTPVYFTSGIYYFEQSVRFSGSANVVVGGGAEEGCTNDQEAAFYAVNAPVVHNISGLGATFVFGSQGRLVVDTVTAGTGARVIFNKRYTSAADVSSSSSAGVSIVSVNGEMSGASYIDLDRANSMFVPKSMVAGTTPVQATDQGYRPSALVNGGPGVTGRYVRVQLASTTDALSLAEVLVNGVATNGTPGEIARSKTTTQSSTEGAAAASRAVDGNTNGVLANGSVSSTTEADEPNPWWQVEVGPNSVVNEVVLHNRTDACCAGRLTNYTVFVSQTDMTGRSYADLLADPAIAKVTQSTPAGAVATIPFVTAAAPLPIVDVNLTTAAAVTLRIPGYVAVPQGRLVVNTSAGAEANKTISIGGGILAGTMEVSAARPATFEFGLVNPVVLLTLKIVTTTTAGTPVVTSTAVVQVKENGANKVNSWQIQ
ncbi:MAG: discoidin domain-containing protein [Actinobacteria bacterium]|nr:discoidin domain-containing protein [Actinomycetota bacterium]